MIKILIEKLEFSAIIGTLDFERKSEQRVRVWAKLAAEEFIASREKIPPRRGRAKRLLAGVSLKISLDG